MKQTARGEAAALAADDLTTYRKFAEISHDTQDIRLAQVGLPHEEDAHWVVASAGSLRN